MRAESARVLQQVGLRADPDTLVKHLIVAEKGSWRSPARSHASPAC